MAENMQGEREADPRESVSPLTMLEAMADEYRTLKHLQAEFHKLYHEVYSLLDCVDGVGDLALTTSGVIALVKERLEENEQLKQEVSDLNDDVERWRSTYPNNRKR